MPSPDTAHAAGIGTILLQFFLVTIVGGFLTFLFQILRDRASKYESVRAAKRELIKEIDDLYRSSKQVKRMIRSRMREDSDQTFVKSGFFENQMEALSKVQLSLEQGRQIIRVRNDFFNNERQNRILYELRYAEAYLHDVVEEFEKRCVFLSNASYEITKTCPMLNDFLGPRWLPEPVVEDFKVMEDGETAQERYDALRRIVSTARAVLREDDDSETKCMPSAITEDGESDRENILGAKKEARPVYRRSKSIADECLLLALREMRESLVEPSTARLLINRYLSYPIQLGAGCVSYFRPQDPTTSDSTAPTSRSLPKHGV